MADSAASTRRRRFLTILWIVPLVCVVVTPGLTWIVAERPRAVRFDLGLGITAAVAICTIGLYAILSHGFRRRIRWALSVTTVASLVFFQWPALTHIGSRLARLTGARFLADLAPILVAIALLWLAVRVGREWQFAAVMNVATLTIVVSLVVMAVPYIEHSPPTPRGQADPNAPDVILLIMDAYGRSDMLAERFGGDNTSFIADLEDLGFQVADEGRSNYNMTYASLAAMFDQDYVYQVGPVEPAEDDAMRNALSGNPEMFSRFRAAGYEVAYTENAWEGSHCGSSVDTCIRDGFAQRVLWALGQITILAPVTAAVQTHPFHAIAMEQLQSLPSYVLDNRTEGVPRLTVAHIILPHPPFLRDAECNYVTDPDREAFSTKSEELLPVRRQYYAEQVTCANQKVTDALGRILAEKPDTIVMITGDHGPAVARVVGTGGWTDAARQERMRIFEAYRVPGCESEFYDQITPVNGSRLITSCATGLQLDPLPDLNLWAPGILGGTVTDVSALLDD